MRRYINMNEEEEGGERRLGVIAAHTDRGRTRGEDVFCQTKAIGPTNKAQTVAKQQAMCVYTHIVRKRPIRGWHKGKH